MKMRTRLHKGHGGQAYGTHFMVRVLWLHVCNRAPFLPLRLLQEMVSQTIPLLTNYTKPAEPTVCGTYAFLYHMHL